MKELDKFVNVYLCYTICSNRSNVGHDLKRSMTLNMIEVKSRHGLSSLQTKRAPNGL